MDLISNSDHRRTSLVLGAAVASVVAAVVAGSARRDFAVFSFDEEIDASPEKKVRLVSVFIQCLIGMPSYQQLGEFQCLRIPCEQNDRHN